MQKIAVTIPEAIKASGMSRTGIYEALKRGDLTARKAGRRTLIICADLEAYLQKANELGGKTLVPPVEVPGQGSFAWLAAPEGNIIGIWKPA